MPNYKVVDADKLDADLKVVGDAIRSRGETSAGLPFPYGMAEAVTNIKGGGEDLPEWDEDYTVEGEPVEDEPVAEAVLVEKTIDENGEYFASNDNADGYSKVTVAVPIPDGYIKPSGTLEIDKNGTHSVTEYASVNVAVPTPTVTTEEATVTPTKETQTVTPTNADYIAKVTVNPIPDKYIEPTGTLSITENGTHPVTEYANVEVNVAASGGGNDALAEAMAKRDGESLFEGAKNLTEAPFIDTSAYTTMKNAFYGCYDLTSVPLYDTSNVTDMSYMFYTSTSGTTKTSSLTEVPLFDTSKVTKMPFMFHNCQALTTVPLFDTSKVTSMQSMFQYCTALPSVPLFDTSNATVLDSMFFTCRNLLEIPLFDTRKAQNVNMMFTNCYKITSIPSLDFRSATYIGGLCGNCQLITDIQVRNINANIQVSDGTSYGLLLTVDSLIHLISELRKQSSTKTFTVGAANLEKLANVYVKLVDITDEMRAEDDLIDKKYPFVVCDSTDEGAMLITDYASQIKNWTIK